MFRRAGVGHLTSVACWTPSCFPASPSDDRTAANAGQKECCAQHHHRSAYTTAPIRRVPACSTNGSRGNGVGASCERRLRGTEATCERHVGGTTCLRRRIGALIQAARRQRHAQGFSARWPSEPGHATLKLTRHASWGVEEEAADFATQGWPRGCPTPMRERI